MCWFSETAKSLLVITTALVCLVPVTATARPHNGPEHLNLFKNIFDIIEGVTDFWLKGFWIGLKFSISNKINYSFDSKLRTRFRGVAQCAPHLLPTTGAGGVHQGDYLPGLNRNGWREIAFGWFARNLIG